MQVSAGGRSGDRQQGARIRFVADEVDTTREALGTQRLRDYAERFWADYSRHWKPSTRKRNEAAIFKEILGAFGDRRIDDLAKGDILFWRDVQPFAEESA